MKPKFHQRLPPKKTNHEIMPANAIAGLKTRFTVWVKISRTLNLLGSAASMSLPRCLPTAVAAAAMSRSRSRLPDANRDAGKLFPSANRLVGQTSRFDPPGPWFQRAANTDIKDKTSGKKLPPVFASARASGCDCDLRSE
jgi:hypothetical protein